MDFLSRRRGMTAELARHLSVPAPWLSQMANAVRTVPPHLCPAIERWSDGAVRRWHLRPNDWHLIWPELVGTAGAPQLPAETEGVDEQAAA